MIVSNAQNITVLCDKYCTENWHFHFACHQSEIYVWRFIIDILLHLGAIKHVYVFHPDDFYSISLSMWDEKFTCVCDEHKKFKKSYASFQNINKKLWVSSEFARPADLRRTPVVTQTRINPTEGFICCSARKVRVNTPEAYKTRGLRIDTCLFRCWGCIVPSGPFFRIDSTHQVIFTKPLTFCRITPS